MIFAWQGWMLDFPESWNPQRLEGDFDNGYALIADLHGPKLGLRWMTPPKRFDVPTWIRATLLQEIGQLAANEARLTQDAHWPHATLYQEPDPPGRDVWLAVSQASGRTIEIVYHLKGRDQLLSSRILPGLQDTQSDDEMNWSVFDLNCRTPPGWRLAGKLLNAGDLSLEFSHQREKLMIRQISMAALALKRQPIEEWLKQHVNRQRKEYVTASEAQDRVVCAQDGRDLCGMEQMLERRKMLFWKPELPATLYILALHDESNNRLLIAEGADRAAVENLCKTVGWAMDDD